LSFQDSLLSRLTGLGKSNKKDVAADDAAAAPEGGKEEQEGGGEEAAKKLTPKVQKRAACRAGLVDVGSHVMHRVLLYASRV
jgi:hypothetical protein